MGKEETDTDALKFHLENKEKIIVIPSREMEPGAQNFPSSYPVPAVQGGRGGWISLGLHSTDTALPCPHLSPGAKTLLAQTRVCSVWEQHIQATFTMFFLLCIKDTPVSHGPLKSSQDLFSPLLSTSAWKIPSQACHKTLGTFPVFSRRAEMWSFSA